MPIPCSAAAPRLQIRPDIVYSALVARREDYVPGEWEPVTALGPGKYRRSRSSRCPPRRHNHQHQRNGSPNDDPFLLLPEEATLSTGKEAGDDAPFDVRRTSVQHDVGQLVRG